MTAPRRDEQAQPADRADPRQGTGDPFGVAALVVGCIGIVAAGLVLTIVTAVLASVSGSRARDAGRSLDNAYLGLLLAAVDGVSWIVLHLLFELPFAIG